MRSGVAGVPFLLILFATAASADQVVSDTFGGKKLDKDVWCECQINQSKTPVKLWQDPQDKASVATIKVDESSVGGKDCKPDCQSKNAIATLGVESTTDQPEMRESLGPPLNLKMTTLEAMPTGDPFCTEEVRARGELAGQDDDDCNQRQELRFQSDLKFRSDYVQTFAFRFRMPIEVYDKKYSVRWITAQWKQEPYDEAPYVVALAKEGPSPIVAQRYDDGILRVTLQSDLCRCVIAEAIPAEDAETDGGKWKTPSKCVTIDETTPGKECTPNLQARYENGGVLQSPFPNWVEMKYVMRVTGGPDSYLEVHQNGKRIVQLKGVIGYKPSTNAKNPSMTKFKIGIYRDYIPQEDHVDVDWLKVDVREQ